MKTRIAAAMAAFALLLSVAPAGAQAATSTLVTALGKQAPELRPEVLRLALQAHEEAASRRLLRRQDILTVIDYSLASTEPRLWVFDLATERLLFREHVAHGQKTGGNYATRFSNDHGSHQTSLGLFVTEGTYMGSNGYSLRLNGLEKGVNDRARSRAIVMHGADYVNPAAAKAQGRLGRSWGCPAVRSAVARKLIDTVKGGSALFAYYPEASWLASSAFVKAAPAAVATARAGE